MQVNDLLRQGKADAGFAAFPHVEALKDVGQISLGNAISIVPVSYTHLMPLSQSLAASACAAFSVLPYMEA